MTATDDADARIGHSADMTPAAGPTPEWSDLAEHTEAVALRRTVEDHKRPTWVWRTGTH
jgi:hypothetical protein